MVSHKKWCDRFAPIFALISLDIINFSQGLLFCNLSKDEGNYKSVASKSNFESSLENDNYNHYSTNY